MSIPRKRRSTGKVTIADVAQLAGVGTMTVSRALRTPEQVSDKLREKIEAAVHELGYMPNLAASALASASSHTIAMVVPNLAEAGCSEMFAGLQQILQPAGYQIMLAESQHRVEQEEKLLETLLASNIAAAILLSVEHSTTVRQWLKNASIPVMEMGAIRSDPIDMNIGIDNVAAMYELDGNADSARLSEYRATMRQSGAVDFSATSARLVQSDASPPYVAKPGD
ncbi:transcriptional regulator [Salmonella enterica subsp. enterica]|uniref:Transcriptional regulator n=1 Tax=Salmonella enterica I TaxID=59201 RepID=A0A447P6X9_SALET|nr:transcriptional regulator [Salmonella enterica subsp. enterica]